MRALSEHPCACTAGLARTCTYPHACASTHINLHIHPYPPTHTCTYRHAQTCIAMLAHARTYLVCSTRTRHSPPSPPSLLTPGPSSTFMAVLPTCRGESTRSLYPALYQGLPELPFSLEMVALCMHRWGRTAGQCVGGPGRHRWCAGHAEGGVQVVCGWGGMGQWEQCSSSRGAPVQGRQALMHLCVTPWLDTTPPPGRNAEQVDTPGLVPSPTCMCLHVPHTRVQGHLSSEA